MIYARNANRLADFWIRKGFYYAITNGSLLIKRLSASVSVTFN